jgi:formate hydrogenlyase transcriptional activator
MNFANGEPGGLSRLRRRSNMQVQLEHPAQEIKRLQRCLNDLVSVLALPAMWTGGEPLQIVNTLLDALLGMLCLDLIYVRLKDPVGEASIEMVRVAQSRELTPRPQEVCELLSHSLGDDHQKWPSLVRSPIGNKDISIVPLRLGLQGEIGVIIAGSQRADFPGQTERLLLSVAANQAAIGLQEARLLSEQKRVARELDQRVEQRTRELADANEELKREITERKIAEEKLRQDERELRRMTDAIPQAITVLDPKGTVLYVNLWMLDYSGLSLEEAMAPDFPRRIFHPEDVARTEDDLRDALSSGLPFENEQRALGKDGKYRWFLIRYKPLRDEHGHILRWYATGTDIHDRRQSEERVRNENIALREEIDRSSMHEEIVGSSAALREVISQISKVAPTDSTVMIFGETGTGKELIATAIHKRSKRSAKAFIRVNCAAIPPSLVASELFGHEKGAFTGALQRRAGRFESADRGTIFLDEIGDLSLETQVALLRVLQERQFERVGSSQPTSVDVRVLAATHRDLDAAVASGAFRQDLFYRLNVFPIRVPALRERKDDIPMLVEYLVERYAKRAGKRISHVTKKTLDLFQAYDWPGNIRELQNVVERAVILCDGETFSVDEKWLQRKSSPLAQRPVSRADVLAEDKKEFADRERKAIEAALAECQGRVAGPQGAAAKLGIPRQTLEWKIAGFGIDKRRFKGQAPSQSTV